MIKSFRHLRNPLLQLHFLLLFMLYYTGSSFFSHIHIIDGQPIAHSHPFAASNSHEHTSAEFSLLTVVTNFSATEVILSMSITAFWVIISAFGISKAITTVLFYYNQSSFLRPPPCFN